MASEKLALVTGAARRLGAHLALDLADRGFDVLVHYRKSKKEALAVVDQIVAKGQKGFAVAADFSEPAQIEALFAHIKKEHGQLDLLVNNVGNYPKGDLSTFSPEAWNTTLQVNLNAVYACCHHALSLLLACKGQVINLGYAGVDHLMAHTKTTAYSISKTGVLLLTKALAQHLGPQGVRVNMISPGQLDFSVDLPQDLAEAIPLGRAGTAADVTQALGYLLSADYVTGVNVAVTGGYPKNLT